MLVLTRKSGEQILIGDDIVITVLEGRGDGVRIGIDAPRGVKIHRQEVLRAVAEANVAAAETAPGAEERIKAMLAARLPAVHQMEQENPAEQVKPEQPKPVERPKPVKPAQNS